MDHQHAVPSYQCNTASPPLGARTPWVLVCKHCQAHRLSGSQCHGPSLILLRRPCCLFTCQFASLLVGCWFIDENPLINPTTACSYFVAVRLKSPLVLLHLDRQRHDRQTPNCIRAERLGLYTMASSCALNADLSFGPIVKGCRGGFDFTLLFEEAILTLLPSLLAFVWAAVVLLRLRRRKKVDVRLVKWREATKTVLLSSPLFRNEPCHLCTNGVFPLVHCAPHRGSSDCSHHRHKPEHPDQDSFDDARGRVLLVDIDNRFSALLSRSAQNTPALSRDCRNSWTFSPRRSGPLPHVLVAEPDTAGRVSLG